MDYFSLAPSDENPNIAMGIINVTTLELEFLDLLEHHRGNLVTTWREYIKAHPMTVEEVREFTKPDSKFWRTVCSERAMWAGCRRLTPQYVTNKLVDASNGKPMTNAQLRATELCAKAVGLGQANTNRGKVSITDASKVEIVFGDETSTPQLPQNPATGLPGPFPGSIEVPRQ